eukprot:412326_1
MSNDKSYYFEIKIIKYTMWIEIGVANKEFKPNDAVGVAEWRFKSQSNGSVGMEIFQKSGTIGCYVNMITKEIILYVNNQQLKSVSFVKLKQDKLIVPTISIHKNTKIEIRFNKNTCKYKIPFDFDAIHINKYEIPFYKDTNRKYYEEILDSKYALICDENSSNIYELKNEEIEMYQFDDMNSIKFIVPQFHAVNKLDMVSIYIKPKNNYSFTLLKTFKIKNDLQYESVDKKQLEHIFEVLMRWN